jgi:hypothetical protein
MCFVMKNLGKQKDFIIDLGITPATVHKGDLSS